MNKFKFLLTALVLSLSSVAVAGIDCQPGMGNCPDNNSDTQLPGGDIPTFPGPTTYLAIGYFEVPSPDCKMEDLARAITGAKADALRDAQRAWGTTDIVQVSEFRISNQCAHGIDSNSSPGLSWIVQAFADYAWTK